MNREEIRNALHEHLRANARKADKVAERRGPLSRAGHLKSYNKGAGALNGPGNPRLQFLAIFNESHLDGCCWQMG